MAATRSKRKDDLEKLPEKEIISRARKILENRKQKKQLPEEQEEEESPEDGEAEEIPFAKVKPLPEVTRKERSVEEMREPRSGYRNRAPLQNEEKGIDLVKEALKSQIHITAEDLLNISDSARQELKKLLTKKRVEKISLLEIEKCDDVQENVIHAEQLPGASYEILEEEKSGMPKGSLIIGDPVVQYLGSLQPKEIPKRVVVAQDSLGLRAVYPLINGEGKVESLLDGGSQIVSMAKEVAIEWKIAWNPDITVFMESANRELEKTLGLARNVPFVFGNIVVYLQVHIINKPAYKILLGRPFDSVTESLVKNEKDGSQTLILTDPNTGERSAMQTYERGKQPKVLEKPITQGFHFSMN